MDIWPWLVVILGLIIILALPGKGAMLRSSSFEAIASRMSRPNTRDNRQLTITTIRQIVFLACCILVLACALFVILSSAYADPEKKWAFGVVGTVLGASVREYR
jgi:hypothetical protein